MTKTAANRASGAGRKRGGQCGGQRRARTDVAHLDDRRAGIGAVHDAKPDAPLPAAPNAPKQNAGWFKKGQPGPRLTTGLYSDSHPAAASIVAAVERFTTAARIDDGGDDLPARRVSLIDYRGAIVHKNILKVALALEERGLFDKRGKLRIAWLSKLESLINTAVRIDSLLGLARQARRTQTPREWLEGLPDRQGGQDAHAHADEDHAAEDSNAEPAHESTVD